MSKDKEDLDSRLKKLHQDLDELHKRKRQQAAVSRGILILMMAVVCLGLLIVWVVNVSGNGSIDPTPVNVHPFSKKNNLSTRFREFQADNATKALEKRAEAEINRELMLYLETFRDNFDHPSSPCQQAEMFELGRQKRTELEKKWRPNHEWLKSK